VFEKFFGDPTFDFETRTLFGEVHYGAGDVGEMLAAIGSITDGDAASWVSEWRNLLQRIESIGDAANRAGQRGKTAKSRGGASLVAVHPTCVRWTCHLHPLWRHRGGEARDF
jgi:hypothetical protein